MAILKDSDNALLACNQSIVLAGVKKNVAKCIKKIEPVRRSPRLLNSQQRVSPRVQEMSDDQKPTYQKNGSKRKRSSDGLKDKVSKNETKVMLVEDITCRSDLAKGNNSGPVQVKDVAMVKETLRVFTTFYLRFVQVIT